MRFTTPELNYIASLIQTSKDSSPKVAALLARIQLTIAKQNVAALNTKSSKETK